MNRTIRNLIVAAPLATIAAQPPPDPTTRTSPYSSGPSVRGPPLCIRTTRHAECDISVDTYLRYGACWRYELLRSIDDPDTRKPHRACDTHS